VPTELVSIDGIPATWFGGPERAASGTLLYLHGGAWCLHLPRIYARFASILSDLTGMRVLLPEYRLAPEHPFPAGVDDCFAVYRWMLDQGYRQRPFALAGDSAGGSLSLVTMMRARDALLPMPDCAALLSPYTDLTASGPSMRYNAEADPIFAPAAIDLLPDQYCPGQDRRNPLLSPLLGHWHGLPPLLFHAGSTEMLLDDSVRAHDRATQAGVAAEIDVYFGLPHVWQAITWLPEARQATRAIADFVVRKSLKPNG
jgi:acetyl esterase/lipase